MTSILILSWIPLAVMNLVQVPDPATQPSSFLAHVIAFQVALVILAMPAYLNNIIYALQHKDYKNAYKRVIGMKVDGEGSEASKTSSKRLN
jgi:hypothetical protein